MKKLLLLLSFFTLLFSSTFGQHRSFLFNNTEEEYIYTPSNDIDNELAYLGHQTDGSQSSSIQSIIAGVRMKAKENIMFGVQFLQSSETLLDNNTLAINFTQRFNLNKLSDLSFNIGTGLFNTNYTAGDLVYLNPDDPVLSDNMDLYSFHINTSASYVFRNRFTINIGLPYLLKRGNFNTDEFVFNMGYKIMTKEIDYTIQGNVDRWSKELIYGASVRGKWNDILGITLGGDNFRVYGGTEINVKNLGIEYVYAQNHSKQLNSHPTHQFVLSYRLKTKKKDNSVKLSMKKQEQKQTLILRKLQEQNEQLQHATDIISEQEQVIMDLTQRIDEISNHEDVYETRFSISAQEDVSTEDGIYFLIIAAANTEKELDSIKAALKPMGINGKIIFNNETNYYYLFIDQFKEREDAVKKMKELREIGLDKTWIHVYN
ncbi:SPOR domain-containing protein [Flammeovirga agarivorans]|uniref:Type IX secretion system membrane protein PorP/SprF n=1 Tax=Flammeovirga agarivorans TaxID=2726742 RepID=A0A7X8SQS2_9BACT|nr:SPOR domain-containing protein [Flammeovirga agarivorans]NLR94611.1 type IX secretion system membrane protein PorP/SprF [Flammeovirga agarivorans]